MVRLVWPVEQIARWATSGRHRLPRPEFQHPGTAVSGQMQYVVGVALEQAGNIARPTICSWKCLTLKPKYRVRNASANHYASASGTRDELTRSRRRSTSPSSLRFSYASRNRRKCRSQQLPSLNATQ